MHDFGKVIFGKRLPDHRKGISPPFATRQLQNFKRWPNAYGAFGKFMNSNRILEIYEDFAKARIDRISEILDEKIDFISHAPTDVFPYLGRRRGRAEVLQALEEVHDKLEVLSFWPLTTVVDGDQAALTVLINVKERATDKTANFLAAHFLRFRNNLMLDRKHDNSIQHRARHQHTQKKALRNKQMHKRTL